MHQRSPLRRLALPALLLLQLIAPGAPLQPRLSAQQPQPPDSARRDSVPPPQRYGDAWGILPVLAAFTAALAVAPPALLLVRAHPDTCCGGLPGDRVTAYVTAGGMGEDAINAWTHSENLEIRRGHLLAALRVETFGAPGGGHVQFQTVRAGYLVRSVPQLEGGVTLGYRRATGPGAEDAVEIGLPLALGNRRAVARFEPTYVISRHGVTWNYRFQGELPLRGPLVAGAAIELKPLRQGGRYYAAFTLLFGVRQ